MANSQSTITKEHKGQSSSLADRIAVDHPLDIKIGYVGGGSRGWFPALAKELALCPWFSGEVRLYDIDQAAAEKNAEFGNALQDHPRNLAAWRYRAVPDLKQALRGADFVFLSIQPGPIQYMKADLELPEALGIYQSVGDTVGPGGIVRGFRTVRVYREFAEAIARHCPEAWVLNFTNPLTVGTRALYAVWPDIRAYGCCHEVFGSQDLLADLLARKYKVAKPGREDVRVNVLGVNHFTWIDRAEFDGTDLLALLLEHVQKPAARRLYTKEALLRETDNTFAEKHRVKYELTRRFGLMAAAGDRHLAEFVPWFLTGEDSCYRWGFRRTPYAYRIHRWKTGFKERDRFLAGKGSVKLENSGEEFINQMACIAGLAEFRTNVNLPNRGQVENLPRDAVVETNALFSECRVEPIASGSLPEPIAAWVNMHVANQEAVVKAALTADEDLGFRAFINDPLVHRLDLDDAWKLFRKMLNATHTRFE
ncbi:MAG: alpha-glucosidase/alpha-galactosidase [Lentisphaerae bacterium]|nr:alpha-glucosidase/alpha-galactosidase [Lentisphaerota bacterium]